MCDNVKEKNSKKAFILIARDFFLCPQNAKKNNRDIASNKSLNHNIHGLFFFFFFFFFAIFLCSHIGYHPQEEDFAKFGYKSERKVKFKKKESCYILATRTYCLNMAIFILVTLVHFSKESLHDESH
jgi:hypothetical protein